MYRYGLRTFPVRVMVVGILIDKGLGDCLSNECSNVVSSLNDLHSMIGYGNFPSATLKMYVHKCKSISTVGVRVLNNKWPK